MAASPFVFGIVERMGAEMERKEVNTADAEQLMLLKHPQVQNRHLGHPGKGF